MSKKPLIVASAILATSLALSACSNNSSNNNNEASQLPTASASPSASEVVSPSSQDFPSVNFDLASTRHVPYSQITQDNISDLGIIWSANFKTIDSTIPNGNQSFPIVQDGVLYVTTAKNHVFAFDAVSGKEIWHWKPDAQFEENIKNLNAISNRGVAVAEGKVFMLTLDNRIVAIDANTGQTVNTVVIADAVEGATVDNGYYESAPPVYFNGNLYIGSSGGDNGVRGFVMAYKASDLSPAWETPFWTVPPKGEEWLKDSVYNGGGTVWCPVTIDEETGMLYFGTGNPAPYTFGKSKPGDNSYTNTVLALDSATGELIWSRQEVTEDQWDYDAASTPILITAPINGETHKIIAHGSKSGEWWAWDAEKGITVYSGVIFSKIDHPTPNAEGVLVYPGMLGGQNYAPSTYDPKSNYLLIPGIESPSLLTGYVKGGVSYWDATALETPADVIPYGTVTAIDVDSGKMVYQNKTDHPMRGGFTSTAAGLAFYGELNGKMRAIEIKTGKTVWEFQVDGDNIMSAPAIFTKDNKEYIAITTGGKNPQLFVFGLGGDQTQGTTSENIQYDLVSE